MVARLWYITFVALALGAGCGSFETPSIVLDLRILGMSAEPPEIVTPFDPDDPDSLELEDVEVCALVADPNASRGLAWGMVACAPTDSQRCDEPDRPFVNIGSGTVPDPEEDDEPVQICDVLPANAQLLAVLQDAIENDQLSGFGGVKVQIELYVHPADGGFDEAQFAVKGMLYSPQYPPERVANTNPHVEDILLRRGDDDEVSLPLGRCNDLEPLAVARGERVRIEPVEPDGVREEYFVPSFEGDVRMFTESLSYAWYATAGGWTAESTGGPKDPFGNEPVLFSDWVAPGDSEVVGDGLDVRLWLVQRDERGGLAWYESCLRVVP